MTTTEEVRAWCKRNADMTRGVMGEFLVWDELAKRGEEFHGPVSKGRALMTKKQCFTNSALTVLGATAVEPAGLRYAEGFALSAQGFWVHHAWVVTADGQVMDRTWRESGSRYVGVALEMGELGSKYPAGCSQLAPESMNMAWAPNMTEAQAEMLFKDVRKHAVQDPA